MSLTIALSQIDVDYERFKQRINFFDELIRNLIDSIIAYFQGLFNLSKIFEKVFSEFAVVFE